MPGLLDLNPVAETVTVRGGEVAVSGVSAHGLALLLKRFPQAGGLVSEGAVSVDALLGLGGEVVAAIIAAGCGDPGNKEAERVASALALADQVALLDPILRLTLPDGLGPFVAKLVSLAGALKLNGGEDPISPKPSPSPSSS